MLRAFNALEVDRAGVLKAAQARAYPYRAPLAFCRPSPCTLLKLGRGPFSWGQEPFTAPLCSRPHGVWQTPIRIGM